MVLALLLPTGSEEKEVLGVGSIPVAILPFFQDMKTFALQCREINIVGEYSPQRQYSGHNTPLGHHTDRGPIGLGQYDSLGEYCNPHTASSVFLILLFFSHFTLHLAFPSLQPTFYFVVLSSSLLPFPSFPI